MVSLLLFIYGIIQIILYTIVSTLSTVYFFKKHNPFFLALSVLFTVFILDITVIMMTENIPLFSSAYDEMFTSVPSVKTVLFSVSSICFVYIYNSIFYEKIERNLYIPVIFMILLWLFIPMYNNTVLKVYIYYEVFSIFMIYLGIKVLRNLQVLKTEKSQKLLKRIGIWLIIFGISIMIEDYFVIFNIDSYIPNEVSIQNRCFSEDIFRSLLSFTCIDYIIRKINPQLRANIVDEPHPLSNGPIQNFFESSEENEGIPSVSKEEKLTLFSKHYDLTTREIEILKLILEHKSAQEISDSLYIAVGTAKTHMHKIYQKLGVAKKSELIYLFEEFKIEP